MSVPLAELLINSAAVLTNGTLRWEIGHGAFPILCIRRQQSHDMST